jgi:hypothetical protein
MRQIENITHGDESKLSVSAVTAKSHLARISGQEPQSRGKNRQKGLKRAFYTK